MRKLMISSEILKNPASLEMTNEKDSNCPAGFPRDPKRW